MIVESISNIKCEQLRYRSRAGGLHILGSLFIAMCAALPIFLVWYPYPYSEFSGGWDLFFIIIVVDVVCGPLLTTVLFNPTKQKSELRRDLLLIVLIQMGALTYGLCTMWEGRPLFLVHEVDRFKVISALDLRSGSLRNLPDSLVPHFWQGPTIVAIREPKDSKERNIVMFESALGGLDFAERPNFYIAYDDVAAQKVLARATLLTVFLKKYPSQQRAAENIADAKGINISSLSYLPVIAKRDWIAVLNEKGHIQGFLQGDGF